MIFSTRTANLLALPLLPVILVGVVLFTVLDCLTTPGLFGRYVRIARGKVT